jgi:hypothetical protein
VKEVKKELTGESSLEIRKENGGKEGETMQKGEKHTRGVYKMKVNLSL